MRTFAVAIRVAVVIGLSSFGAAATAQVQGYAGGTNHEFSLPTIETGFVSVVDQFPPPQAGQPEPFVGQYPAQGLMLVASGQTVYLQTNHGVGNFVPVATTSSVMDPAFVSIDPDGTQIAIGMGFNQPLLVFPIDVLDPASPPELDTSPAVQQFTISYQDGAWIGPDRLALTGGLWPGPGHVAGIGVLFTDAPQNPGQALITNIPGASGGMTVDAQGNFYTGLGYAPGGGNRTGEIRVFPVAQIDQAITTGSSLTYDSGVLLAENVLSASTLQSDMRAGAGAIGNLFVGGGDAFGGGGAAELGYGAGIDAAAIASALQGGGPVSEASTSYIELAPDPCQDDSATTAVFGDFGGGIGVMWNPTTLGQCQTPGTDSWGPTVTPRMTVYFDGSAPDSDNDGVPDSADNAYLSFNPGQQDDDGDGIGNIADADITGDDFVGFDDFLKLREIWGQAPGPGQEDRDLNSDGIIGFADFFILRGRYQTFGPWF